FKIVASHLTGSRRSGQWHFDCAALRRVGTPAAKHASGLWVKGIRHFAADATGTKRELPRCNVYKSARVRVQGLSQHIRRRALLDDMPKIHYSDILAEKPHHR